MNRRAAIILLALALACDEPFLNPDKQPEAGPVVFDGSVKPRDGGTDRPPLFTDAPHKHQIETAMTAVEFIGWSTDGNVYVIDTKRGMDSGDLAGSRQIELREVRDSRSGELIASFRIEKAIDKQVEKDDELRLAWAEAAPMKAYKAFAAARVITQDAEKPKGWSVAVEVAKKSVPALSKVAVKPRGLTTSLEWRKWEIPKNAREKALKKKLEGVDQRPSFAVTVKGPEASWAAVVVGPPYTSTLIAEASNNPSDDTVVRGSFVPHWSPDGKRVLMTVGWDAKGLNQEMTRPEAHVYVRVAGPQISLAISKDERPRAGEIVRAIEDAGYSVASVGFAVFEPPTSTSVSFFGKQSRSAGQAVAKVLGGAAKANAIKGWQVSAVVAPKKQAPK